MDEKTQHQEQGRRYTISEAARELGLSAEWLRIGERRNAIPAARRDCKGHRYYTREDIRRLGKGRARRAKRKTGP